MCLFFNTKKQINKSVEIFKKNIKIDFNKRREFLHLLYGSMILSLFFLISCSKENNISPIEQEVSPIENGWTVFEASEDTRKVYVSSSEGDDSNDGLSPESPKKTVDAGIELLRDNMPDWLLFKKGDEWPEIGGWRHSGRSNTERMVITSYGDGLERPKFSDGISVTGGGGTPEVVQNLAFVGLAVVPEARNPKNPTNTATVTAINWLRGGKNILFEDCYFRWAGIGMQDFDKFGVDNVTFRRSLILDSYSLSGHAQGMFIKELTHFTLDECIFDHNGWAEELPDAAPNVFNHNIYFQYGLDDGSFSLKNTILSRGSSHGIQARSGGRLENNLFMENAINILIGSGDPDPANKGNGVIAWVTDNVILDSSDIIPRKGHTGVSQLRGWALNLVNIKEVTVSGNIASNTIGGFSTGLMTEAEGPRNGGNPKVDMSKNITIGYGADHDHDHTGPFKDPTRDIKSYMKHIGLSGGIEEFMVEARKQQKGNWREEFTAAKVNAYIREGFMAP